MMVANVTFEARNEVEKESEILKNEIKAIKIKYAMLRSSKVCCIILNERN